MNDEGKSVFARYIVDSLEKEQCEPEILRRGPQPIVPLANCKSLPSEKLLDWIINHWAGTTIRARDICRFGPNAIRDRKSAISQAEILVKYGWLVPLATRQHNMKKWQIVRGIEQIIAPHGS